MNPYIKICITAALFLTAAACSKRDEVFEKEQYKAVFALVSGEDNIYAAVHDLREPESTGHVSASLGGSNPFDRDVVITLANDASLVEAYNTVLYVDDRTKYFPELAPEKYAVGQEYQMTIRAGERKASIPIRIRPEGLSPDSSYMFALRVQSFNAGEINPEKDYLIYSVRTKNWWAEAGGTAYTGRGSRQLGDATPINSYPTKKIYPLAANTVRLAAGIEEDANVGQINAYSITVEISDHEQSANGKKFSPVRITPYKTVNMTQINGDPDYPNIAMVETDEFGRTFKTFLLCYSFIASDGFRYLIKEELQLQFRIDPNDPRFLPMKN